MNPLTACLFALVLFGGALSQTAEETMQPMKFKRLTPVLFVEKIEPSLDFWVTRLGFQKTVEVPEGDALGFVALERDGIEVMLQSYASADKDSPAVAGVASRVCL